MHNIVRRSERERRELFRATAQAIQVHEATTEKDFWVCWVLDYLFQNSPGKARWFSRAAPAFLKHTMPSNAFLRTLT